MVRDKPAAVANCDSTALDRNVEIGHKHKINGTPTLIFSNGTRVPGAIASAEVEKYLADSKN